MELSSRSRMNSLTLLILVLVIFTACSAVPWRPDSEQEEVDGRKLFLSMLMPMSRGGEIACYSFYFTPSEKTKDYYYVLILSTGHCADADASGAVVIHENQDTQQAKTVLLENNFYIPTRLLSDFYIGYIIERRPTPTFFTIDKRYPVPLPEEKVFTVAVPAKLGPNPELQNLYFEATSDSGLLIFKAEKENEVGISGAPVATDKGRLLGVLIASVRHKPLLYLVMPITRIIDALRKWYGE